MRIFDTFENPYMPKKCMFNAEWPDLDYYEGVRSGKESGKKEAIKELAEKLNVTTEQLENIANNTPSFHSLSNNLVGETSKYCDYRDAPKDWNLQIDTTALLGDIPRQNNLPHESKLCGYVEIDGTYHECKSCEHETIVRQIVWDNEWIRSRYFEKKASFYDKMPRGMLQEEYFLMKELGFVKISSFANTPNQMVVFFYNNLTYKQSDLIYPR